MVIPVIRQRQGPELMEMMKKEIGVKVLTLIFAWRKEAVLWVPSVWNYLSVAVGGSL